MDHLFVERSRRNELALPRQVVYYDLMESMGPTEAQRFLMEKYNWSVNQQTLYHAWYKVRRKMSELTPELFIKKYYGSDVVNGKGIAKLMDAYAAYQLSLHIDHPTQPDRRRLDIKRKVNELNDRAGK